ncbi:MAG: diguanylate cyclase [Spirochaetales bacterium]|nr:diguanylate cyclase [Spirochaetales bacterium]
MGYSLINPEIVLTDRIPLGGGNFLTPDYDRTLMEAGVYPWFWDLEKSEFLLTPNFIKLMPEAEGYEHYLYPVIHNHLDREAARQFYRIIKSFIRGVKVEDYDFSMTGSGGGAVWLRVSGRYQKKEGRVKGVIGTIRNISETRTLHDSLEENRNFLDTLINLVPLPIYYKNLNEEYEFFNRAFAKLLKLKEKDLTGKKAGDFYNADEAQRFSEDDRKVLVNREARIYEDRVTMRDGEIRELLVHKAPDISPLDGRVKGLAGFILDRTEQNMNSRKITLLADLKELVLEINHAILSIPDQKSLLSFVLHKIPRVVKEADCGSILLFDGEMFRVYASFGYVRENIEKFSFPLTESFMYRKGVGIPEEVVIINDLQELLQNEGMTPLLPTVEGGEVNSFMGAPIIRNGRILGIFSLDSFSNHVFGDQDVEIMTYLMEQLAVILDKQELYQKVLGLSRFDSLSGLSNRHYFQEQARATLGRAERMGQKLVILLADLDSLKPVNDCFGHEAGDAMIRSFSSLLKESFRDSDILGRMGGDEFTAVFHDTDRERLEARMESFRREPKLFKVDGGFAACRFSFGTAEFPTDSSSLDELIGIADKRMYEMKLEGKKNRGPQTPETLLVRKI